MKKLNLLLLLAILFTTTYAQKSNVQNAEKALRKEKLSNAVKFIEEAYQNSSTSNDVKMHKVMGYYHEGNFVAFSLLYELDKHNLEAIQFAWDYKNPKLRLGVLSLENECDWAQTNGYKYLYLGRDDIFNNPNNYKSKFKGYEILGTL